MGADFLYPQTEGERPLGTRFLNWYNVQLFELSARNSEVVTRFHEVMQFVRKPAALFHPYVLFQVIKWGLLRPLLRTARKTASGEHSRQLSQREQDVTAEA